MGAQDAMDSAGFMSIEDEGLTTRSLDSIDDETSTIISLTGRCSKRKPRLTTMCLGAEIASASDSTSNPRILVR